MTTERERTRNKAMRIGFILFPVHLLGLHNYLRNLLAAIATLPGAPITPVLLTGRRYGEAAEEFADLERVCTSMLDRKSPAWFARKCIAAITGRDLLLERLLQKHGITVLSHSVSLGRGSAVKTLGWIADLQHMRLPELFSAEERHARDRSFHRLCDGCDAIAVSSACGLEDLRVFSPENVAKGRVLHFVSAPTSPDRATPLADLEQRYGFRGPYFLLPNQFWPHKNHRVVIDALKLLKDREQPVSVLCTGSTTGPQDTAYFPALMEYAKESAVLDHFRVLGVIPFDDLSGLMYGAVAFINPSRFEGWSTSVEEAKSMGKTIVLSDIPVHREQNPNAAHFFSPDSPDELASALEEVAAGYDAAADAARQQRAREAFAARRLAFGQEYRNIVVQLTS